MSLLKSPFYHNPLVLGEVFQYSVSEIVLHCIVTPAHQALCDPLLKRLGPEEKARYKETKKSLRKQERETRGLVHGATVPAGHLHSALVPLDILNSREGEGEEVGSVLNREVVEVVEYWEVEEVGEDKEVEEVGEDRELEEVGEDREVEEVVAMLVAPCGLSCPSAPALLELLLPRMSRRQRSAVVGEARSHLPTLVVHRPSTCSPC